MGGGFFFWAAFFFCSLVLHMTVTPLFQILNICNNSTVKGIYVSSEADGLFQHTNPGSILLKEKKLLYVAHGEVKMLSQLIIQQFRCVVFFFIFPRQ